MHVQIAYLCHVTESPSIRHDYHNNEPKMKPVFQIDPVITGHGAVSFRWQKSAGKFLAVAGLHHTVNIFDRSGNLKSKVTLQGSCSGLDWDKDGDILAIVEDKLTCVYLWNTHSFELTSLDTGFKDIPTLCCWAQKSSTLAVGTVKGNLLLYNHRTRKKVPVIGKHTKKILCGAWNNQNLLALGSDDRTLTISNLEGDTIQQIPLRHDPYTICFGGKDAAPDSTLSAVLGGKTLFFLDLDDYSPVELAFQQRYGNIVSHKWCANGNIIIGFSNGFFVVISSEADKMGQELFQAKNHRDTLSDVAVSRAMNQGASCGDHSIKIHDLEDVKDVYNMINVEEEKGQVAGLQWTPDGQLLTVSTNQGHLLTYLTKLPLLGAACGGKLAYLSALLEATVVGHLEEETSFQTSLPVEPSFLAIGPYHLAVGLNNRAWFYTIGDGDDVVEKSYLGAVSSMALNGDYAAAVFEGKILLHLIESDGDFELDERKGSRLFPEAGSADTITCAALTNELLVFATQSGGLHYFHLEEWATVNEFHHPVGIVAVYPDAAGIRVVFVDDKGDALLYNPVQDACVELPNFPQGTKGILWDSWVSDRHVFVAFDGQQIYTYVYSRDTVEGPACAFIGTTKLPFGQHPLMLHAGEVSCQTLTGKISVLRLATHTYQDDQDLEEQQLQTSFDKCIALKRLQDAWNFASAIDSHDCWKVLANVALLHLDVALAIRANKQVKDVATVLALQRAQEFEDRNQLAGYIMMMNGNYDHAQDLFMKSSNPKLALEMRRDLLNWDQAVKLARALAPDQVPEISMEYARQLEYMGDFGGALRHFEEALTAGGDTLDTSMSDVCHAGVARAAIRTGDIRRGVSLAQQSHSKGLKKECADVLESLKLFAEAGLLYEHADSPELAVAMYTKTKNWDKVGKLLPLVSAPKYHGLYAKAKEADGQYQEAAKAYKMAQDYDNFVRVTLDHLHQPEEAVVVVRETKSIEGAKMIARHFQRMGDPMLALQFLVVSQCNKEAFEFAKTHGLINEYTEFVGPEASQEDFLRIAQHFQDTGKPLMAGKFFLRAKQYAKALRLFLSDHQPDSEEGSNIELAIQTIGEAQQENLTQELIEFLMGERDEQPKDAKYLFQLHMALKQYREAARTAIIIAREHQNNGNYKHAHDVLFNMYQELQKQSIKIPAEMAQNLMLLHSYTLVKTHVKLGNHMRAARLLLRVANSISKFPSHTVPILTSAVIECQRSGLKGSGFNFAAMLMRPDLRSEIDQKWKKKIEQIVRKPDKSEIEEEQDPCPFCGRLLPQSQLDCPDCKNTIPYCIASGRHIVKEEYCQCPKCHFPAILSEFTRIVESAGVCAMCSEVVDQSELQQSEKSPFE